jgi:hypothetical protein
LTTFNTNFVYFTNSTNNGANWTALYPINTTTYSKFYPSIGVMSNGNPIVFWYESQGTNDWIVSRNFTNAWGDLVYLTPTTGSYRYPNSKYNFTGNCIEYVYLNRTIAPDGSIYCNATYPCYVQYNNIGTCSAPIVDTTPPTYSLNSTNSTLAGTAVMHSLYWQDDYGLSYAIFSFDNCTGSLQNITGMALSGTSAWSNFTVGINSTVGCTIRWCVYANDTSNNWNGTSCLQPFSYTTTSAAVPQVYERNLSLSISFSTGQNKIADVRRGFVSTIGLSDLFVKTNYFERTSPLSLGFSSSFSKLSKFERFIASSMGLSDVFSRAINYIRTSYLPISLASNFEKTMNMERLVGISAGIEGIFERMANYGRTTSSSIGITSLFARTSIFSRFATIGIGLSGMFERITIFPQIFERVFSTGIGFLWNVIKLPWIEEDIILEDRYTPAIGAIVILLISLAYTMLI